MLTTLWNAATITSKNQGSPTADIEEDTQAALDANERGEPIIIRHSTSYPTDLLGAVISVEAAKKLIDHGLPEGHKIFGVRIADDKKTHTKGGDAGKTDSQKFKSDPKLAALDGQSITSKYVGIK